MFSLNLVKQQKLKERPLLKQTFNNIQERKRPIYPLCCNSAITIIAEIKKASPSSGTIRQVDVVRQATLYQQAGAKAVSVLADNEYFGGSYDDVYRVAKTVKLPVLCKEFICSTEQIDVAYNAGADIILLIKAMLTVDELQKLYTYTIDKGLLPLIEVHTTPELKSVLSLQPEYIMVNIRNLNTLELEYDTAIDTLQKIPDHVQKICASGVDNPGTIQYIKEQTGTTIYLVGTALMKAADPHKLIQELCNVC